MSATKWGYILPFLLLAFHKSVYLGLSCFHKQCSNYGSIQIQQQSCSPNKYDVVFQLLGFRNNNFKKKIQIGTVWSVCFKVVRHKTDTNIFNSDKWLK